ncbi:hypothetical protein NDU88_004939 [Pleurodeles waltl]|uniref:Uncharacterized protein n=1 Tax=Pleurodeles waltl TaxID=8319 RepID=A0AAV7WB86_PLEWA|nr:hypothetical protein NDU88_004939 [Pleurodeles waltl]
MRGWSRSDDGRCHVYMPQNPHAAQPVELTTEWMGRFCVPWYKVDGVMEKRHVAQQKYVQSSHGTHLRKFDWKPRGTPNRGGCVQTHCLCGTGQHITARGPGAEEGLRVSGPRLCVAVLLRQSPRHREQAPPPEGVGRLSVCAVVGSVSGRGGGAGCARERRRHPRPQARSGSVGSPVQRGGGERGQARGGGGGSSRGLQSPPPPDERGRSGGRGRRAGGQAGTGRGGSRAQELPGARRVSGELGRGGAAGASPGRALLPPPASVVDASEWAEHPAAAEPRFPASAAFFPETRVTWMVFNKYCPQPGDREIPDLDTEKERPGISDT